MLTLILVAIGHTAISFTAARWWLRPLLLGFDRKYKLPPCRESDFYFFCFTWSIILVLIAVYGVWRTFVCHVMHPAYRAVLLPPIKVLHEHEDD